MTDISQGALISTTEDLEGSVLAIENSNSPAQSPTTNFAVSNYMGFGSYSGADIKAIVHYPSTTLVKTEVENMKIGLQNDLDTYLALEAVTTDPNQSQDYLNHIDYLQEELSKTDDQIRVAKNLPTSKTLAEIQTLSWSIYRDKAPFRPLGSVYPKSYTRGSRTIGGSMVFAMFYKHVLHELLELNLGIYSTGTSDHDSYKNTTALIDQLPPLDLSFVFANEYGALSYMGLYGVEFIQEGATFSIEDIYSEAVVQYVARDIDPIRMVGTREIDNQGVSDTWTEDASGLMNKNLKNSDYRKRRNPFI